MIFQKLNKKHRTINRCVCAVCIALSYIIVSCDTNEITPIDVTKELTLYKSTIIPDFCYTEAFIKDSFIVLITSCDDNYFHIFNKNTLKLVRKFGKKGKAPFEFHFPQSYVTNTSSKFNCPEIDIYDVNLVKDYKIDIPGIASGLKEPFEGITSQITNKKLAFSNGLGVLQGNKIAGRGLDESKGLFYIYDNISGSKRWIDYKPRFSIKDRYKMMAYYGYLSSNSTRIVYASRFMDEVLFYNSDGELMNEHYFSSVKKPILSKKFSGVDEESMLYFVNSYGTPDFCYVIRLAYTAKDLHKSQDRTCKILSFDWDGNLKNVYQYHSFPQCFCVDEATKTMYFITHSDDLNSVKIEKLVYK